MTGLFGGFDDDKEERNEKVEADDDKKLLLRQEELDIDKERVETGEVTLSKEIVEEIKTVNVPIKREELVIKRRAVNEMSDSPVGEEETIHIPLSEERVDIGKHTVVTGEVTAYIHEVEETKHIEETLRREEARVNTTGDPSIVHDEEISNYE
jgi:uncharacterized protein (TIGR02271 family)